MERRFVSKMQQSLMFLGLLALVTIPANAGHPIKVSISPTSSTVAAGQTCQFTASVTNTSNKSVIWTATAGTISTNGLYTAPASPSTVTVKATSVANTGASASATVTVTSQGPPTGNNVLWSAGMETGNTSEWYYPATSANGSQGGQIDNTGGAAAASRDYAHSGSYSLKMSVVTPPESGTAASRWLELSKYSQLNYTGWYYFPNRYSVTTYWNVLQWGSKNPATGQVDPFFIVNIGNRSDGSMYLYLYNWQTHQSLTQSAKNVPVNQWTKIDAFYASAGDGAGHITIWQDGTKLFDVANVQTRYANGNCQVSFRNLSDSISPSPAVLYLDDVSITTSGSPLPPPITPLTVISTSLPGGTVGSPYAATLTASGGTPPYTWSLTGGSLPSNVTLNSGGTISGTPNVAGVYSAGFQVKDSASPYQTALSSYMNINIGATSTGTVVWSADMETGDKTQWNNGGGEFNSGSATASASTDYAHGGRYSLKMSISTPSTSAVRMFRWQESRTYPKLHYSTWFYFPQRISVPTFWNILQWKSSTSTNNDPFFVVNVGNRGDGSMYLYLYNWQKGQGISQSLANVPVGRWFKVEADYTCAGDGTGRITLWQDGTQLIDVPNVQTRYSNGDCQWSVDNYSDGLNPSPTTIYADDAQIIKP